MAKVNAMESVGIFVSSAKRARDFYTKTLGLKVLSEMPGWGYVELGLGKGRRDAVLNLWTPKAWGLSAAEGRKRVGVVTGVGFATGNLAGTVATLRRKGARVEVWEEMDEGPMATVFDPDGNSLFIVQSAKRPSGKGGLRALDFVTISSRNAKRTGAFFQKVLGMKKSGAYMATYRLASNGTALMPFTPNKSMYEDPADYKADLAAIGEETAIMFSTPDVYALEERWRRKGVRFKSRAKPQDWGGVAAEFFDPDRNVYTVYQVRKR